MQLTKWISDRWRFSSRFRIFVVAAFVLLIALLLFPFKTTTVPDWSIRVLDDSGAPVREINVTEHWQDFPLELSGHEEARTTDQNGLATFQARSIRANLVTRLYARLTKPRTPAAVPYGAIVVWGSKDHETTVAVYHGDGIPQSEIRVRRSR